MGRRYIYQVHIADGFVDDCDELMHRCSKVENITFEAFTEIWKKMNFASIYQGRSSGAEVAELSEEVLQIAKRYMVANTSNYEESVAALFLVYGLLSLQPFPGFAALRIVPDDVPAISRIELVARREHRLDVLYILGKVLIKGPTQYHAENREYGMDHSIRKYLEGYTSLDKIGIRPKGVFYRQNEELDIIRELNNVSRLYENSKAKITDEYGRKDPNLSFVDQNLPKELDSSLKKLINGLVDEEKSGECMNINDRSMRLQGIKRRAMKNTVDPIKHLTGLTDRKATSTNPRQKPDIRTTPGKVRTGSPKKPITSGSPQKRKPPTKRKTKAKRKKMEYSSSETSDEDLTDILTEDDDDDIDPGNGDEEECSNVENIQQSRVEVEICDINKLNDPEEIDVEKEYDIEIDTMPIVIKSNSTQKFEIEIIDHYQGNAEAVEAKKIADSKPGFRINKKDKEKSKDSNMASVSKVVDDEETFKKPISCTITERLRKPNKCDLKKTILKSKFKKMGLEPVANFVESEKPKTTR